MQLLEYETQAAVARSSGSGVVCGLMPGLLVRFSLLAYSGVCTGLSALCWGPPPRVDGGSVSCTAVLRAKHKTLSTQRATTAKWLL